ncbi:MAG: glycosyltransferase [Candidatus Riflemargulisbacteria bacterium]
MVKVMSVIIGTYNLKDKLKLVLNSLSEQSLNHDLFEVIVVDSESDDGTEKWLTSAKFTYALRYIRQKNEGKSSARNRGIKEATTDLVLITDADMIADKDLLKEHYNLQKDHGFSVLVEGKTWVLKEESLPVLAHLRRPYITHKVKHGQKLGFYYCLTGNLSFPKKFFNEYGGFDESFKNYGWEDVAYGYELIKNKKETLIYSDKAVNYHFHVWSDLQEVYRRENMGRSVHILLRKYPELKTFLGINILNTFVWLILSNSDKLTQKWIMKLSNGQFLSKWKKLLLREYFFQKGYLSKEKF